MILTFKVILNLVTKKDKFRVSTVCYVFWIQRSLELSRTDRRNIRIIPTKEEEITEAVVVNGALLQNKRSLISIFYLVSDATSLAII